MSHHDFTELETKAIDDVIRAWRTWSRARGRDPDQPSRIDLYAFAQFLSQQAEKDAFCRRQPHCPTPGYGIRAAVTDQCSEP
jgi:hypothetical protein